MLVCAPHSPHAKGSCWDFWESYRRLRYGLCGEAWLPSGSKEAAGGYINSQFWTCQLLSFLPPSSSLAFVSQSSRLGLDHLRCNQLDYTWAQILVSSIVKALITLCSAPAMSEYQLLALATFSISTDLDLPLV